MGRVVAFSELDNYLDELDDTADVVKATILDTNIIIALTYEIKTDHEAVIEALEAITSRGYKLLATVTTKAEFLEFHRRLLMTENLLDAADPASRLKLPQAAKTAIQNAKAVLNSAIARGSDAVFGDKQIKDIKKSLSAGKHSGHEGWMALCKMFLDGKLSRMESELLERGIEYVSQHVPSQASLFTSKIDWPGAIAITERTAPSFSDAMILNAFYCSHSPFIVTTDFDCGYSVLADSNDKVAVMPDADVKKYKSYHLL